MDYYNNKTEADKRGRQSYLILSKTKLNINIAYDTIFANINISTIEILQGIFFRQKGKKESMGKGKNYKNLNFNCKEDYLYAANILIVRTYSNLKRYKRYRDELGKL